ncbi:MAG: hypothetical protein ACRDOI_23525 [Trebonia sp.]
MSTTMRAPASITPARLRDLLPHIAVARPVFAWAQPPEAIAPRIAGKQAA